MIKMDIEGAELPALVGCTNILRTGPDLAIAGYHRPNDLVDLPEYLASVGYMGPAFHLHIAHYSECFDDTILYFLRNAEGSGTDNSAAP
jgi:hypothetical protein